MTYGNDTLPEMLRSFSPFQQWIETNLDGKTGHAVGDPWNVFARTISELTPFGSQFSSYKDNPRKTRDGGWDFIAYADNKKKTLYGQSKFKIASQNEFDSIISAFATLSNPVVEVNKQTTLFDDVFDDSRISFVIVTLSDISSAIVPLFRKSQRPSTKYFKQWEEEGRIFILDGPKIWAMFREWYLKSFGEASDIAITFASPVTKFDQVYLGITSASEIRRIYEAVGDAIFFENVRDFMGDTDINDKIAETISREPEQFLKLNNGIVFSTSSALEISSSELRLEKASIINGCQTATTLVRTHAESGRDCYVQVKIVVVGDNESVNWKVTHAANYQNEIKRIDLDLARHIRPQVVKRQSWWSQLPVSDKYDPWSVIDTFNSQKVTWRNIRILFIALFSREPGNAFDVNFDNIRGELLAMFLKDDDLNHLLFDTVFQLHLAAERGAKRSKAAISSDADMSELFARLLGDTRAPYMQYLAILAICAFINKNIAERNQNDHDEFMRMKGIIADFSRVLSTQQEELDDVFFIAFEKVATDVLQQTDSGDKSIISNRMFTRITKADKFTNLWMQVKLGLQSRKRGLAQYDSMN